MILDILTENTVEAGVDATDWEEAVRAAGELLFRNGYAERRYIDSMVDVVKTIGPYIVLIKGVALAHARPKQGARAVGLTLITLKTPVNFGSEDNDPVSLVFALSALDHSSHLELITEMGLLLDDGEAVKKLADCSEKKELITVIRDSITKKEVFNHVDP